MISKDYLGKNSKVFLLTLFSIILVTSFVVAATPQSPGVSDLSISKLTDRAVTWTWENPSDPDFESVQVFINGILETETLDETYTKGFFPETTNKISLKVKDKFGNINHREAAIMEVTTLPKEEVPPRRVTKLQSSIRTSDSIFWYWENPSDPDFSHTQVFLNHELQEEDTNGRFNATNLDPNTEYRLSLKTVDESGAINHYAAISYAHTLPDSGEFPEDPQSPGVSDLSISKLTDRAVTWTWENPSDPDFESVQVFINGILETETLDETYSRGFAPETTNKISLKVKDKFGNINHREAAIMEVTTLPKEEVPPRRVTKLQSSIRTSDSIFWYWENPSDPDFSHSQIFLDSVLQEETSGERFNATDLDPEKTYRLTIKTVDESGAINHYAVTSYITTLPEGFDPDNPNNGDDDDDSDEDDSDNDNDDNDSDDDSDSSSGSSSSSRSSNNYDSELYSRSQYSYSDPVVIGTTSADSQEGPIALQVEESRQSKVMLWGIVLILLLAILVMVIIISASLSRN